MEQLCDAEMGLGLRPWQSRQGRWTRDTPRRLLPLCSPSPAGERVELSGLCVSKSRFPLELDNPRHATPTNFVERGHATLPYTVRTVRSSPTGQLP